MPLSSLTECPVKRLLLTQEKNSTYRDHSPHPYLLIFLTSMNAFLKKVQREKAGKEG